MSNLTVTDARGVDISVGDTVALSVLSYKRATLVEAQIVSIGTPKVLGVFEVNSHGRRVQIGERLRALIKVKIKGSRTVHRLNTDVLKCAS